MTLRRTLPILAAILSVLTVLSPTTGRTATIWVEGEKPVRSSMTRHPWWYDQVKRDQLSGGDMISNWNDKKPGEAEYRFEVPADGEYELWVRANPVGTRLSCKIGDASWKQINMEKDQVGNVNVAADNKIDLRFLAWVKVGKVALQKGPERITFRMNSNNNNHGMLDCFVLSSEPFQPRGILKPEEIARLGDRSGTDDKGWFAFDPKPDPFRSTSAIDLRSLNEKEAGADGYIAVKDGQLVHSASGQPVRFWAVNGPSSKDREGLRREARLLAKYGVNMVRYHHGYCNEAGEVDMAAVRQAHDIVEAMKAEGIYVHFSIYFPLWLRPKPGTPWLEGYDGRKIPFAALFFNKDFQKQYQSWWKALLLTRSEQSGKRLIDEPAVSTVEIINEDSYFFWTFTPNNIPDPQLRILEKQFGDWLTAKYGSIDKAIEAWKGQKEARDRPEEGRAGFRPLWNMANERTPRDKDAARFLVESQRGFYRDTYRFLHDLGFRGLVTASNWATADPRVLGPLEKYTYTACDFIDRHGYFGCRNQGEGSEWSVRDGHLYMDRSALRFDPEEPGKPRNFVHPVMDPHYNDLPSMISETTFNRPNRYRSEAPLYYAAYGALQGSDAIVHFADDTARWSVKPGYFMQPWTLMSPAMMGQFPAAALIYRKGLVSPGDLLVDLNQKIDNLLDLQGTPLPQDASLDELRLKDVTAHPNAARPGSVIDPLVHFAGRTSVHFGKKDGPNRVKDLSRYINHAARTVRSTTGELTLDYGKGLLTINAPQAQGLCGALREAGTTELKDIAIASKLELGNIIAISLDGRPLASSEKILLQVMSEEKGSDFRTEPAGNGMLRITSIGHDPWLVRDLQGMVKLRRNDAAQLQVTALDANGYPDARVGHADAIRLRPHTLYYLITP